MECGDCTVCCTLSAISELNKKSGELCTHCVNNECQIYGKHPQVCKDFECAYLQGGNNIELRPDKCGIMFWKKSERIFCGALMPETSISALAVNQINSFKKQGYSVVLLKIGEKPHIEFADNHNKEDIYTEYINTLINGNI